MEGVSAPGPPRAERDPRYAALRAAAAEAGLLQHVDVETGGDHVAAPAGGVPRGSVAAVVLERRREDGPRVALADTHRFDERGVECLNRAGTEPSRLTR